MVVLQLLQPDEPIRRPQMSWREEKKKTTTMMMTARMTSSPPTIKSSFYPPPLPNKAGTKKERERETIWAIWSPYLAARSLVCDRPSTSYFSTSKFSSSSPFFLLFLLLLLLLFLLLSAPRLRLWGCPLLLSHGTRKEKKPAATNIRWLCLSLSLSLCVHV